MQRIFSSLKNKIEDWCLSKETISIGDFHNRYNPNKCLINDENNNLKFIEQTNIDTLLVETNKGYSPIKKSFKTIKYQVYEVILEDGKKLKGADNHILINSNYDEILVKDLKVGDLIITIDGPSKIKDLIIYDNYENMYDLELDNEDHLYYTNGILSHNTSVVAIYILWMATFLDDKLCVIASKNMDHATEIMSRIKFSYEELPHWLKAGAKFYNRTSIEFDNGSIIKSQATTEKTGRGGSPSILMLDEISFISQRIQVALWASIAPSLSTGGKLIMTTTPNGDTDLFARLWRGSKSLTNSFVNMTILYTRHPDRGPDSGYYEEMVGKLGELVCRVELGCEFLSTDALLVSSMRLNELKSCLPFNTDNGFKFWEPIKEDAIYLVGVDPATGSGSDYSVIEVFEFPSLLQVAEYRSNDLNIPGLYKNIKWIVNKLSQPINKKRPEVFWTFERNGVGEAIAALYIVDENPPQFADLINEGPGKYGMQTLNKSKVLACLQLKTLIEKIRNGIQIRSEINIFELKNFVSTGAGYAAKSGATDDSISALLLIVRLLKYVADFDDKARMIMYEHNEQDYNKIEVINNINEDDEPLPFVHSGGAEYENWTTVY